MPWIPELFSAPVLDRIRRDAADARAVEPVPYFDGVRSGDTKALVGSLAGEPELHHPIRGRVRGGRAFERFVTDTNAWLTERKAVFSPVERILTPRRGIEETVMTLDGDRDRVEVPVAVAADRNDDVRIIELRVYWSMWPLTREHQHRAPLLGSDPDLREPDVVGIRLEHCALTDDGRACALEYNIVRWGRTELSPEAGVAVFVRGSSGKLASARLYDDADPSLGGKS